MHEVARGPSLEDVLHQLFRNARLSGATHVAVHRDGDTVVVSDDGSEPSGAEPSLRSLASTVTAETEMEAQAHFPAGHQDPTPGKGPVTGNEPGTPRQDAMPPGDRRLFVLWHVSDDASWLERITAEAAKHYPLPVTLMGQPVPTCDFLQDAVLTTEWKGLRIGVFHQRYDNPKAAGRMTPTLINDHGRSLTRSDLPTIEPTQYDAPWSCPQWLVRIDVRSCPAIEPWLSTPATEVAPAFHRALRDTIRDAIFHAIAQANTGERLKFQDWQDAREAGFMLPDPPPLLSRWKPTTAACNFPDETQDHGVRPSPEALGEALLLTARITPWQQQALKRAADRNGISDRLWCARPLYEGYPWYDRLGRIIKVRTSLTSGRSTVFVNRTNKSVFRRTDTVTLELTISRGQGTTGFMQLPTDMAFAKPMNETPQGIGLIVAKDSTLTTAEAARLMFAGHYVEDTDPEAATAGTQEHHYLLDCENMAAEFLESRQTIRRRRLQALAETHLQKSVEAGEVVTITLIENREPAVCIENEGDVPNPAKQAL